MRAPLTIIIPTLNAQNDLPGVLQSAYEAVEVGILRELVISDGGSTDATLEIAREAGAIVVTGPASRGGQLRRGAEAAGGAWLLFLHADTRLSTGWTDHVEAAMRVRQAGYFKLAFDTPRRAGRFVAGWANLRSRLFGLPYGDQGLLVPARLLKEVGGVPDQPLMEDVALARALRGKLSALPVTATTSFIRYETQGVWRRGLRNLSYLLRYLSGADPHDLVDRYRR